MLDIVSKISTRKENILMKRVDRYNISKPKKVYFILLITLNSYSFNTEYYVFFDVYLVLNLLFYIEQFSQLQVRTETVLKGHSFKKLI